MADRKVALVTGGNRGIGLEVGRQLIENGFQVVLTCRNLEDGQLAAQELEKASGPVSLIQLDVSNSRSIHQAVSKFGEAFEKLDVLVNNAGILLDAAESILSVSEAVIRQTIETNSIGPLRVVRAFLPYLRNSKDARVINVSSLAGQLKNMDGWAPAYSLSKTALNAITRLLSHELKPEGIKVNSVSPGWIRTEMGGAGAPGTLEEGADTIVWLATEASGSLTGQFLRDREPTDW